MICDGCENKQICKYHEHAKILDANQGVTTIDDVFVQKYECKYKRMQTEGISRKPVLQSSIPNPNFGKTWDKITYCSGGKCTRKL